jgi:L-ascorbate metabolism protein UlaG (beta-lactamase superfamily)
MPRFANLEGADDIKGLWDVLKWQLGMGPGGKLRSPKTAAIPWMPNDGAALQDASKPTVTWIGHATFLVQLGGKSILTDPILSDRIVTIRRNVPPGLSYETLPPIDAVVLTHNHRDHMDEATLRKLGPKVRFFVPRGLGRWFRSRGLSQVTEMDWWQKESLGSVEITFVPSQHWSRRGAADTNQTLWGGYVMEQGPQRVYHSGDTAYFGGFKLIKERCGAPTTALLPIGAYEPRWFMKTQHMNPEDAVQAYIDLGAKRFVAMHWGTFKLTDEPLDEPPRFLRDVWAQQKLRDERLFILAIGETLSIAD